MVMSASAKIVTQRVEYKDGDVVLEGFVAYDDALTGKLPAVGVVHDWNGLDAYEEGRAKQLAELGYVGFALDIYGKGVRPTNAQESAAQAGKYRSGDRSLFRSRLKAGMDFIGAHAKVDASRLACIGYCFGGSGVLEIARMGYPVKGVASFHGGLDTTRPAVVGEVKAKVIAFHAWGDPAVPPASYNGFLNEMQTAKVDFQTVVYNLNVHAFTVPGSSYDANADRRSFESLKAFLAEVLAK